MATDTLSPAHMVKLQQIINYREKLSPRTTNPSGYWRVCFCLRSDWVFIERDVCFDLMAAQRCPREPGCQNRLRKQSREMQAKSITAKAICKEHPWDGMWWCCREVVWPEGSVHCVFTFKRVQPKTTVPLQSFPTSYGITFIPLRLLYLIVKFLLHIMVSDVNFQEFSRMQPCQSDQLCYVHIQSTPLPHQCRCHPLFLLLAWVLSLSGGL